MHVAATLSLMPYQEEGVTFLLERPVELDGQPARLLADEMGLGKTVQACVALKRSGAKSALVIVPHPIKTTWAMQLVRWGACTEEQIFVVKTGSDVIPPSATHIIVNYDLANGKIKEQLMKRYFAVLIVDEAQRLKGIHSLRSHHVLGKDGLVRRCVLKWFLSGTIMPNRPVELYTLLKTMAPQCITPHLGWEDYGKYFCNGYMEGFGGWNFKGASHIDELRERIKPFMLRREVKDVYPQLPPAVQSDVFFDVGEMLEDEQNTPTATLRMLVGQKKMPYVLDYIKDKLDEEEEKILVFTFSRSVTEGLQEGLAKYGAVKYYGGMSPTAKEEAKRRFLEDSNCRVLVAQIVSAGTGIDELQHVCSTIVFAELDWSAGDYDQAICRLRRIGQEKIVRVYKCIALNTLDEPMDGSRRSKKKVMDRLLKPQRRHNMSIETILEQQLVALNRIAAALEGQAGVAQIVNETKPEGKPAGKPKQADKPAGTAGAAASKPASKTAAAGAQASNAAAEGKSQGSTATSAGASSKADAPTTEDNLNAVKDAARDALKRLGSDDNARDAVRGVFQKFGANKAGEVPEENLVEAAELLNALGAESGDDLLG